jgi:hypothetical protein
LELITLLLLERGKIFGVAETVFELPQLLLMLCVLFHVFKHEFFHCFLQFFNPALNHIVFLMDVHKINVLGWYWVQVCELTH